MYNNIYLVYNDAAWYCDPLALALKDTAYAELCLIFQSSDWCTNSLFCGEWIVTVGVSIKSAHEKKITHFQTLLIMKAVGYFFTSMTHDLDLVCVETNIGCTSK